MGRSAAGTGDGGRVAVPEQRHDIRLVPAAIAIWVGTFAGLTASWRVAAIVGGIVTVGAAIGGGVRRSRTASAVGKATASAAFIHRVRRHSPGGGLAHSRRPDDEASGQLSRGIAVVLVAVVVGVGCGMARAVPVRSGPVSDLAAAGAYVRIEGVVTTDPRSRANTPGHSLADDSEAAMPDVVTMGVRVDRITGRGVVHDVVTPVIVTATDLSWLNLRPGQPIAAGGRLAPADDGSAAAFLRVDGPPDVRGPPSVASRATEPFRQGLREAVAGTAAEPRGLIPGLVIGDESLLLDQVRDDMNATNLTHLTAVSGTNVTIMLVVALGLARWCGLRGRTIPLVGLVVIGGFVLLARPEPSVIRAATMGAVAVIGLTVAGRRRGLPALATAVVVLLLADPWLARSPGFAMSVLATGGILLLVPRWQSAMWWLPSWMATALAVPIAAQVVCTPVLVTLSGAVSLVSVPANLLAAPLVAPATILGVAAAAMAPAWLDGAAALAWLASWPAHGIVTIAAWGAGTATPVVPWPAGTVGTGLAVAGSIVGIIVLPRMLRRPAVVFPVAAGLLVVVVGAPTPGWPPPAWVVVACDVGQGDGFALRVDEDSAVVVDSGGDPRAMRRCLDGLGVTDVPVLVLTHFHADHVLGTPGVLAGRTVGRALVSPVRDPVGTARDVTGWLRDAGVPVEVGLPGARYVVGADVTLEVVWPRRRVGGESAANDGSVVVLAQVQGVSVLFTGDIGRFAQSALLHAVADRDIDILKVPHHGSADQDDRLLTGLGADVALIGVGSDNTYGHPAPSVVHALTSAGQRILRTDLDGTAAVVQYRPGLLGVVRRGRRPRRRTVTPRRQVGLKSRGSRWYRHAGAVSRTRRHANGGVSWPAAGTTPPATPPVSRVPSATVRSPRALVAG